jgi:hypothetical protein
MIRLALRTLPVFAVIIGFAMALAAYMNFSGVRSAYLDLIRSRMIMMAEDIANNITTAQALGIRLAEQSTLPALLARQAAADPLMLSVDVVSETGETLFSSEQARVGTPHDATNDLRAFRHEQRIINDFGAPLGVVVIRLDRAAIDAQIDKFRFDILYGAVPAGLGAVIAGSIICLFLLTLLHRRARRSAVNPASDDPIERAAREVARIEPGLQT